MRFRGRPVASLLVAFSSIVDLMDEDGDLAELYAGYLFSGVSQLVPDDEEIKGVKGRKR